MAGNIGTSRLILHHVMKHDIVRKDDDLAASRGLRHKPLRHSFHSGVIQRGNRIIDYNAVFGTNLDQFG